MLCQIMVYSEALKTKAEQQSIDSLFVKGPCQNVPLNGNIWFFVAELP